MSLSLRALKKSFKGDTVLDGISLDVPTGETLVLFGPSGAGKTVLLRLIAGVLRPDAGTVAINGDDVTDLEPEDRGVGMAFQNFALFPHMNAAENIAAPLAARRTGKAAVGEKVRKVAELLKIDHVLGHAPKELSNGQKQRTSLARALSAEPSILLLDDPLRNVDAKLRFEMRLELPRLLKTQNATVIYVTQDYKEAMALGHRIAVLGGTSIAQIGTPEDIYLTPANIEIAKLFGDPVINLLEVTPEKRGGALTVQLSDHPVAIDRRYAATVGTKVMLGVRPEAVRFVAADVPGAIPVEVEAVTPLNEKIVTLCLTKRKREIMVSRPSGTDGPSEGNTHIAIDAANALFFDAQTGSRIEPGTAPASTPVEEVA